MCNISFMEIICYHSFYNWSVLFEFVVITESPRFTDVSHSVPWLNGKIYLCVKSLVKGARATKHQMCLKIFTKFKFEIIKIAVSYNVGHTILLLYMYIYDHVFFSTSAPPFSTCATSNTPRSLKIAMIWGFFSKGKFWWFVALSLYDYSWVSTINGLLRYFRNRPTVVNICTCIEIKWIIMGNSTRFVAHINI